MCLISSVVQTSSAIAVLVQLVSASRPLLSWLSDVCVLLSAWLRLDSVKFPHAQLKRFVARGEELETATRRGKYAIIASCSEAHFQDITMETMDGDEEEDEDDNAGHGGLRLVMRMSVTVA